MTEKHPKHYFDRCPAKGEIARIESQLTNGLASKVKTAIWLAKLNIGVTVSLIGAALGVAYFMVQNLTDTNRELVNQLNAAILTLKAIEGVP